MSLSELEKEFEKTEGERQKAEKRRQIEQADIKPSIKIEALKVEFQYLAEELKTTLTNILEVAQVQNLEKETNRLTNNIEQTINISQNTNDALEEILGLLRALNSSIGDLNHKISDELNKQDKHRQLEQEAIQKLNNYLNDWI